MDPDLDMLAELFNESGQPVAAGQDVDLHGSASAAGSVMTASDDAFSVDDDRSRKRARTTAAVASAGAGSSSPQMRPKVRATKSAANTQAGAGNKPPSRRRLTHNASEQRRVRRIGEQVDKLRTKLRDADRSTKNDKCSVLAATVEYVADLEQQAQQLREEIRLARARPDHALSEASAPLLNYREIFRSGGIAQVVSSPSGEFLDCNDMFSSMSGFPRTEITKYTMFHLTHPSQLPDLYRSVGELLSGAGRDSVQFTKTCLLRNCAVEAYVVMKMIRDSGGHPKYFVCSVMPLRRTPIQNEPRATVGAPGASQDLSGVMARALPTNTPLGTCGVQPVVQSHPMSPAGGAGPTAVSAPQTAGQNMGT